MEPFFPIGASLYWVFGAFGVFLIIFHLILVPRLKVQAWKVVEYIWLGFAALGLFGAVEQVREIAARDQISMFQQRATVALSTLRSLVTIYQSNPGPVCRTFTRSEYSPPQEEFEKIQREYNEACAWFKQVVSTIPAEVPMPPRLIEWASVLQGANFSLGDLKDIIRGIHQQVDYYNGRVGDLLTVYNATQRTTLEETLVFLGPFLLAIALALRITKVTGEMRLGRLGQA